MPLDTEIALRSDVGGSGSSDGYGASEIDNLLTNYRLKSDSYSKSEVSSKSQLNTAFGNYYKKNEVSST